jgi:multidrug efflux pump subunit AcrA (membrane-fusion protein)
VVVPAFGHTQPLRLQVDKPAQHRLGVRTRSVSDLRPPEFTLPGRVVVSPVGVQRIAADQTGMLQPPADGFPLAGQTVMAGDVLAVLHPTLTQDQRGDLQIALAQAERDVTYGQTQIQRYSIEQAMALEGHLLTPSVQIVVDYQASLARRDQLRRALDSRIEIVAPVGGRLLASSVRTGQSVMAGDVLFETVSGGALALEVPLTSAVPDADTALYAVDDRARVFSLRFIGRRLDATTRTPSALYAVQEDNRLAAGQPLHVTFSPFRSGGVFIPQHQLFQHAGSEWVWTHAQAEAFAAMAVTTRDAGNGYRQIETPLPEGTRLVVSGAAALSRALERGAL